MFERITKIENSREADGPREKHLIIELTDREHMEKMQALRPPRNLKISKEMAEAGFVYCAPFEMEMTPALKEKVAVSEALTKDIKVINLHEKSKSKAAKRKSKRDNSQSNKAAMENIQAEL